jgi:regulator of protease activity HflC (stomatin/prohibitin superfamily)
VLSAVYLTNFDFSDAFEAAVEAKMIAEQEKLKAETEKQIAIIKAEQDLEISKINAEKAIAVAQGEARAVVLAATAQADALKIQTVEVARMLGFDIIETSYVDDEGNTVLVYNIDFSSKTAEDIALISKYVEYIAYLETWNGVLPQVITDGSVSIFIPIP